VRDCSGAYRTKFVKSAVEGHNLGNLKPFPSRHKRLIDVAAHSKHLFTKNFYVWATPSPNGNLGRVNNRSLPVTTIRTRIFIALLLSVAFAAPTLAKQTNSGSVNRQQQPIKPRLALRKTRLILRNRSSGIQARESVWKMRYTFSQAASSIQSWLLRAIYRPRNQAGH
jgi:hypothetical protein